MGAVLLLTVFCSVTVVGSLAAEHQSLDMRPWLDAYHPWDV